MAHSERAVARLREYVEWIAPVKVYPGEDELQALAEGVFRVLDGEEEAKRIKPGLGLEHFQFKCRHIRMRQNSLRIHRR